MSEWQPIDTAPKDGRKMILGAPRSYSYIGRFKAHSWYGNDWIDESGQSRRPTHWMPLPEPPNDQN